MSKDTIYREDAIKAINARSNWYQVTCNGKQIAVMLMAKDVNEILEKVPSADRPQEWIPCSERLPKIGQKVLASTKKTVFTQVFKGYHSDPKRWAWENNRVKEIEAWQPLPKPWKGADDERP